MLTVWAPDTPRGERDSTEKGQGRGRPAASARKSKPQPQGNRELRAGPSSALGDPGDSEAFAELISMDTTLSSQVLPSAHTP